MQTTITLKKVLCGTELNIVQEGVPDAIPAEACYLVTIDTLGSSFDTLLAVYTGDSVSNLTVVSSNDNSASGYRTSKLTFSVAAGTTYQIAVDGWFDSAGDIVLHVFRPPPLNNLQLLSLSSGSAIFALAGNPGDYWTIQRAASASGPWTTVSLGGVPIFSDGLGQFQDDTPPPGAAFYRAMISAGGGK